MPSKNDVSEHLSQILEELGLTEHERNLYSLSLLLGPTSTATLAEHMHMPRSNVYKVIAGLEKQGLAQFSGKGTYSKTFMVESPSLIVELLRKKQERLKTQSQKFVEDIPNLLTLYKQGEMPTKVKVLQGQKQFIQTFGRVVEEARDEVCFFGSFQHFLQYISYEAGMEHIKTRSKRGIFSRALLLPDEEAKKVALRDKQELRETRFYQTKQPFVTSFYIFANKVAFWQPKTPLAVLVEDEYIVAMIQDMFNQLWEKAGNETSTK
jgi:sugar-specific transcriptional regulator TrmB